MKYTIVIDQLVLSHWENLSPTDALIASFISGLNPNNPELSDHMKEGYFMIALSWLLEQMPLLNITDRTLRNRLSHLVQKKVIDRKYFISPSGKLGYYKMSKLYYQIEKSRHAQADLKTVKPGSEKTSDQGRKKTTMGSEKTSAINETNINKESIPKMPPAPPACASHAEAPAFVCPGCGRSGRDVQYWRAIPWVSCGHCGTPWPEAERRAG